MFRSRTSSSARRARPWPVAANASLLLAVSTLALAMLTLAPPPAAPGAGSQGVGSEGTVRAAVFPPWWNATRSFLAASAAGVAIIRTGAIPAILIVRLDHADSLARLRQAGVWLLLDPQALGGCTGKIAS
jgi:hypothetical protein